MRGKAGTRLLAIAMAPALVPEGQVYCYTPSMMPCEQVAVRAAKHPSFTLCDLSKDGQLVTKYRMQV
jgi:hypothetical protein